MTVPVEAVIAVALEKRMHAIGYFVTRSLRSLYPDMAVLEGSMGSFNLEAYAAEGLCQACERPDPQPERLTYLMGAEGEKVTRPTQMLFDVSWEGTDLLVLIMHFQDHNGMYHYWILSPDAAVNDAFHEAVCAWNTRAPEEYILVFDVSGWSRDEALVAAIAGATLDTLVLQGDMKDLLLDDVRDFFASEEIYARYRVPWKRGILFLGPPGNGKTHAVKALVNAIGQRCVYVKTFQGGMPDVFGIRNVFDQARRVAPCVLVLEDLDSLLTSENRSYFLNELDGFAGNHGILTLATTNHPERLDPAILDRPSRFDRKYPFELPELLERQTYIAQWNQTLEPELRITTEGEAEVAQATDGFSFAYLKELFLAATMRWIHDRQVGAMTGIVLAQAETLHGQMQTIGGALAEPAYPSGGGARFGRPHHVHDGPAFRGGQDVPL